MELADPEQLGFFKAAYGKPGSTAPVSALYRALKLDEAYEGLQSQVKASLDATPIRHPKLGQVLGIFAAKIFHREK